MQWTPFALSLALAYIAYTFVYPTPKPDVLQPKNNAPLDKSLAYYRLNGYNGGDGKQLTHGFFDTECGARLSVHYSQPSAWDGLAGTAEKPILVLTHGYPESSYIWREVAPIISKRVPVVIPDQPGYGLSSACCKDTACSYDRRSSASAILQAVREIYGDSHAIYGGHDRGARTMVSISSNLRLSRANLFT